MSSKSKFIQAGFSAPLLRSAVIAIALLVQVSPARAEVVKLVCQAESGGSFTLQVNYDRKTVAMLRADGSAYFSAAAQITEDQVYWEVVVPDMDEIKFYGGLNRLTGQGGVTFPVKYPGQTARSESMYGPCRRAMQKF